MKNPPPLPPYDQACVRAWAVDYSIRINHGQNSCPADIIQDAKEIEAYLTGKTARPRVQVVVEFKNGKRPK
jgi:hypothetical protein